MEDKNDILEKDKDTAENLSALSEENQTSEPKAFLKVKFNHEELCLDEETAKELTQKGLNYDKIMERLQDYENHTEEDSPDEKIVRLENQVIKLENELKKERENRVNEVSSASPVSSFGTVFDDGLFTEEQLNSMSPDDIKRNLDKALRSMSFISKSKLK